MVSADMLSQPHSPIGSVRFLGYPTYSVTHILLCKSKELGLLECLPCGSAEWSWHSRLLPPCGGSSNDLKRPNLTLKWCGISVLPRRSNVGNVMWYYFTNTAKGQGGKFRPAPWCLKKTCEHTHLSKKVFLLLKRLIHGRRFFVDYSAQQLFKSL